MTYEKLLKEIGVELSEARAMRRKKHYGIMRACLMHIMLLIAKKLDEHKAKQENS